MSFLLFFVFHRSPPLSLKEAETEYDIFTQ